MRVLHVGNIANNGYLNARLLREAGLENDVLSLDYYHIMGCPEWEDSDFDGDVGDDFFPNWSAVDLRGYRLPPWFARGPLGYSIAQLQHQYQHHLGPLPIWWRLMAPHVGGRPLKVVTKLHRISRRYLHRLSWRLHHSSYNRVLAQRFSEAFPNRNDRLHPRDIASYSLSLRGWKRLFADYDIVIGYGMDPIWPLLADKHPYIAFEHGTIRSTPFKNSPEGRLTALAYRQADGVIITNCDNKRAAERLGLAHYRFIPHPINERWIRGGIGAELRKELLQELNADFLIFHPARHHWETARDPNWEKGNDILIKGMARFLREVAPRAGAVFVEWGRKVTESKQLLEELGIAQRVKWVRPLHSCNVSRYMDACDLVADQFFLGAFGSIMPRALAHGKPAMLCLDEEIHRWCFPELPPIINAKTSEEVYQGLAGAYRNPETLHELGLQGRQWYHRYHSNAVVKGRLIEYCEEVLGRCRLSIDPLSHPRTPASDRQ